MRVAKSRTSLVPIFVRHADSAPARACTSCGLLPTAPNGALPPRMSCPPPPASPGDCSTAAVRHASLRPRAPLLPSRLAGACGHAPRPLNPRPQARRRQRTAPLPGGPCPSCPAQPGIKQVQRAGVESVSGQLQAASDYQSPLDALRLTVVLRPLGGVGGAA